MRGDVTAAFRDIADRLLAIGAPSASASSSYSIDALGRTASRTTATSPTPTTDTYSYPGTSETVCRIVTSGGTRGVVGGRDRVASYATSLSPSWTDRFAVALKYNSRCISATDPAGLRSACHQGAILDHDFDKRPAQGRDHRARW